MHFFGFFVARNTLLSVFKYSKSFFSFKFQYPPRMLAPVTLALVLAAQSPATQPATPAPTTTQPQPAAQPRYWLEPALIARYKLELDPLLAEMGASKEDRDWYCDTIFPTSIRLWQGRGRSADDDDRFARLLPQQPADAQTVTPKATLAQVRAFVYDAYARSTRVWLWPDSDAPLQRTAMPEGLKTGLVRLNLAVNQRIAKPSSTKQPDTAAYGPVADQVAAELAAILADPAFQGDNARMVARVIGRLNRRTIDTTLLTQAADRYAARQDADPWFADYFRGVVEYQIARNERGPNNNANTNPAQFKQFFNHLDKAETYLTAAHKRKPQWPEAATAMIYVAVGQESKGEESPEAWLKKALAAEPSCGDAYQALASCCSPQRSGERGQEWAARLIKAAAVSTDCRTIIPGTAVFALTTANTTRQELADALRLYDLYQPLKKMLTDSLACDDPGMRHDLARTWLMLLAYHADKPADALNALSDPNFKPCEPDTVADIPPQQVHIWALINSSTQADALNSAEGFLSVGDLDGALNLYRKALAGLQPGPAADLARSRIALAERLQRAIANPVAVDLSADEKNADGLTVNAMSLWPVELAWHNRTVPVAGGAAIAFGKEGLRVNRHGNGAVYLPASMHIFSKGYEVTFDAVFDDEGKRLPSIGLVGFNRTSPIGEPERDIPGIELRNNRVAFVGHRSNAVPFKPDPKADKQLQHTSRHTVRLLVDGDNAEVWWDGQLADWTAGRAHQSDVNREHGWLSFGADALGRGEFRYEHITIKSLDGPLPKRTRADLDTPKKPPAPADAPANAPAHP